MDVTIREARTDDIGGVLQLWKRSGAHPSATDTVHDLRRVIAAPHAAVLIAVTDDGTIVGSLIATFDGWRGNVYRMAVDSSRRRHGIARQLAAAGEELLRDAGAGRLSALVEGDSPVAQAFWESVGFEYNDGMRRYSKNV